MLGIIGELHSLIPMLAINKESKITFDLFTSARRILEAPGHSYYHCNLGSWRLGTAPMGLIPAQEGITP